MFGDLAQDIGNPLAVVPAVDARDVLIAGSIRLSRGIVREPLRMRAKERFRCAIRIHAGQHAQSVGAGGAHQVAIQVSIAQKLRAVMQRILARIVSHDPARVDDHALDGSPFPMPAPERDVVVLGILLGNVGLAPAQRRAKPGCRAGLSGQEQGRRGGSQYLPARRGEAGPHETATISNCSGATYNSLRT